MNNFVSCSQMTLVFESWDHPELLEAEFCSSQSRRLSKRGRKPELLSADSGFQWTSAVRAVCVLLLRAAGEPSLPRPASLLGGYSSLAAALDYAISKQPSWIRGMFGLDSSGDAITKKLFLRTNPERKRPGPVIISVNDHHLSHENIKVFVRSQLIKEREKILLLADLIEKLHSSPKLEIG